MSARDDYPILAHGHFQPAIDRECQAALDEIDRLRSACRGMSRHIVRHGNYSDEAMGLRALTTPDQPDRRPEP